MPARSFLINAFSATSKLLTPSMYCRSRKTFLTIHWTHFTVNSTCIRSFSVQKMNNGALLRTGRFKWQRCYINHLLMTSQCRHCLQILTGCSKINFLRNLYCGFLVFSKLTTLHHFVTYLSNDPRMSENTLEQLEEREVRVERWKTASYVERIPK